MRRHNLPAAGRSGAFLVLACLVLACAILLAGCGRFFFFFTTNRAGNAVLSLSLRDTAPPGVAVLSAGVTLTGAVLQPGNVALLGAPVRVELAKLQTETLFLDAANVPATAFNGLNVALANPQLTIFNGSGAPVAGCASGALCKVQPRLTSGAVFVPFVLVLAANARAGLVLDLDLSRSLQADLTIQPAISAAEFVPLLSTDTLENVNDFVGQVTSVGSSQFVLRSASSGLALVVSVDASTQFAGFPQAGLPNDFTAVSIGQALAVDLRLLANSALVARRVTFEDAANTQDLEGVVVSTDAAHNRFDVVVLDEVPSVPGVALGSRVTVNLQPAARFTVETGGLTVPLGVSFASAADLLAGQEVQVRAVSVDPAGAALETDRVRLRMSQFTAAVASKSGNGFTLGALPSLFTAAGIAAVQVPSSLDTSFENVSGLAGLSPGDAVSLRGLLFGPAASPTLAALRVRKR